MLLISWSLMSKYESSDRRFGSGLNPNLWRCHHPWLVKNDKMSHRVYFLVLRSLYMYVIYSSLAKSPLKQAGHVWALFCELSWWNLELVSSLLMYRWAGGLQQWLQASPHMHGPGRPHSLRLTGRPNNVRVCVHACLCVCVWHLGELCLPITPGKEVCF